MNGKPVNGRGWIVRYSRKNRIRMRLGLRLSCVAAKLFDFKLSDADRIEMQCGFACGYTEPYGFVPEDGCPIHDR